MTCVPCAIDKRPQGCLRPAPGAAGILILEVVGGDEPGEGVAHGGEHKGAPS